MKTSSYGYGLGALLVIAAALIDYNIRGPGARKKAAAAAATTEKSPLLSLADLTDRAPPVTAAADEARIRKRLEEDPENAESHATLATLLLESGFGSRPPKADRFSAGRARFDRANKLKAKKSSQLRAKLALQLAEGLVEDSLATGVALVEAAPSVRTHHMHARAYLAATCSKACQARHQEQLHKHAPEGAVFTPENEPTKAASSHRAAGMWRVMEAGRTFEKAAALDTSNAHAKEASEASKKLRNLDAFRVSSSAELFELAGCSVYEGRKLDGKRCPTETENPYQKKKKKKKTGA